MAEEYGNWIVETDWLAAHLKAPDIVVLDATWRPPSAETGAFAAYQGEHIPGAVYFDIDAVADTASDLPHMLPSSVKFSSMVRKMGIGDGMHIVVYDRDGLFSAARAWWMFRVMGVKEVSVLNGGLKKWMAEGRDIEDLPPPPRTARHFTARIDARLVRDMAEVAATVQNGRPQIVDARSRERFAGVEEEPREGMRAGHIPGSINLHFAQLINADGTLKDPDALRQIFIAGGVDLGQPMITTCGSGVTAAILALGLSQIGHDQWSLYDGSWSEWGADPNMPIERSETAAGTAAGTGVESAA